MHCLCIIIVDTALHFLHILLCTLGLNRVEEWELVLIDSLKGRVPKCSDGQWLQVQQLSRWWVLLWKDQVTERDWKLSLAG